MLLYEHLGFAFVAALMMIWLAMSAAASGIRWLRGPAAILALLTIAQLALGAGAWFTKFGFGGEVAVRGSTPAVVHVERARPHRMPCFSEHASLSRPAIARLQWCAERGSPAVGHQPRRSMHPCRSPEGPDEDRRLHCRL